MRPIRILDIAVAISLAMSVIFLLILRVPRVLAFVMVGLAVAFALVSMFYNNRASMGKVAARFWGYMLIAVVLVLIYFVIT